MFRSSLFSGSSSFIVSPIGEESFDSKMEQEKPFQHLVFATLFLISVLWSAQAGVKEGLQIHFLALTTLTMMYDWRMAFLFCIPAMVVNHLIHDISLLMLPSALVLSALIPILISYSIFLLSYQYLPRNIFVFIFVAGFFNGALTGSLHLLINSFYHLSVTTMIGKPSSTITLCLFRYSLSLKVFLMEWL